MFTLLVSILGPFTYRFCIFGALFWLVVLLALFLKPRISINVFGRWAVSVKQSYLQTPSFLLYMLYCWFLQNSLPASKNGGFSTFFGLPAKQGNLVAALLPWLNPASIHLDPCGLGRPPGSVSLPFSLQVGEAQGLGHLAARLLWGGTGQTWRCVPSAPDHHEMNQLWFHV